MCRCRNQVLLNKKPSFVFCFFSYIHLDLGRKVFVSMKGVVFV